KIANIHAAYIEQNGNEKKKHETNAILYHFNIGRANDKINEANTERDKVTVEKDKVMAERDKVMAERDKVTVERDRLKLLYSDAIIQLVKNTKEKYIL